VAAEANDEMWPPTLVCLLARSTMAIAFQRVYERMRCSMSWSPGMRACCSTGMVLMYGVSAERLGNAVHARVFDLLVDQEGGALGAFRVEDALQGVQPFVRFLGIGVVGAAGAEDLLWYSGHDCLLVNSCPVPTQRSAGLQRPVLTVCDVAAERLALASVGQPDPPWG
jgi:hypothetical protein